MLVNEHRVGTKEATETIYDGPWGFSAKRLSTTQGHVTPENDTPSPLQWASTYHVAKPNITSNPTS